MLNPYGTGLWKGIRILWDEFFLNLSLQVENGAHFLFWKDKWLGPTTLKDVFHRLYTITTNSDSTIAHNWDDSSWNLHPRRHQNDWEMEDMIALLGSLHNSPVLSQRINKLKWGSNNQRRLSTVKRQHQEGPDGAMAFEANLENQITTRSLLFQLDHS